MPLAFYYSAKKLSLKLVMMLFRAIHFHPNTKKIVVQPPPDITYIVNSTTTRHTVILFSTARHSTLHWCLPLARNWANRVTLVLSVLLLAMSLQPAVSHSIVSVSLWSSMFMPLSLKFTSQSIYRSENKFFHTFLVK